MVYRAIASASMQVLAGVAAAALLAFGIAAGSAVATAAGIVIAAVLAAVLADDVATLIYEATGRPREKWLARLVRFLWRRVPGPRGRPPDVDTIELVVWRGLFRWRGSRHVAVVQDMTPRIHPQLHTPGNVAEFDEYLRYVQRHAEVIATISEHSRIDIIERIAVYPGSVAVMPMPVQPQFVPPAFCSTTQTPFTKPVTMSPPFTPRGRIVFS